MKLSYKNIFLFLTPLLMISIAILGFAGGRFAIWVLTTISAYGLMLLGWILVDLFGD